MLGRKKKSLVVNVVNTAELEPVQETREDKVLWGANASVLVDNIVLGSVILIGAYFAADTLRSVALHTTVTKIVPKK